MSDTTAAPEEGVPLELEDGSVTVILPFPDAFPKGDKALVTTGENVQQQIFSFLFFVLGLGALAGFAVAALLDIPTKSPAFLVALGIPCVLLLILGKKDIENSRNGVPQFLGVRFDHWLLPMGTSWWPFGGVEGDAHVGELTFPLTFTAIESVDNVLMKASITLRVCVEWPVVYVRHGKASETMSQALIALHGLMERTLRWYISSKLSTSLPAAKGEASRVLSGTQLEFFSDEVPGGPPKKKIRFAARDGSADGRTVREIAQDLSFRIIEVLVNDITLPPEVTAAAQRARIEEAEREAEQIEMANVLGLIKLAKGLKPEDDMKLDVSDEFLANLVQTERKKATRVIVDGTGGELLKAAGLVSGIANKGSGGASE